VAAGTAGTGALLSLLRERSGSLAAPVLLHLAANCVAPLASALARPTDDWPGQARPSVPSKPNSRYRPSAFG
jgi:membrane protease YdiL (CAAX protease family)